MSTLLGTTSSLDGLEKALQRLRADLRQMGLHLTVWDAAGNRAGQQQTCLLTEALGGDCAQCEPETRNLAAKIIESGQEQTAALGCGCCAVGTPIMNRRRVIGAAVACFGVEACVDPQRLQNRCNQPGIDKNVLMARIEGCCRRTPQDAQDVLRLLNWLLSREQSVQTANAELATLSANLATTYEELSLLYSVSGCMKVTAAPEEFLQNVCDELLEVMNVEGAVGLIHAYPPGAGRDILVTAGSVDLNADQIHLLASSIVAPRIAETGRPILDNKFSAPATSGLGSAVQKLVAVPLVNDSTTIGMVLGINKQTRDFDSVDLKLVNSIANQTSVFLANSRLYADLQDLLMGVLHALTATIDAKDPYTCGHSHRVAILSKRLAQECGFSAQKVQQVYLSGLLHDIGKIGVPERVLCKEGRLTAEEYELIKRHPAISAKILQGIRQLDEVLEGVVTHHERPDGKGYPRGLAGQAVPIEGLIVGLADSFDSMTSDRTYRKALALDVVLAEIKRCAGTQFDPGLVEKFVRMDFDQLKKELSVPTQFDRAEVIQFRAREMQ